MALFNRLARLAPQNYAMPPTNTDQPNQGVQQNPLAQLSGSQDALGSDTNTPLLDLLQKHLINNYPNPQDYQPSTARKVLGAVAGFGAGASPSTYQGGAALGFNFNPQAAIGTTRAITDEPYQKALGQYDTRAKALEGGAGIEEKQFTNKRLLEQSKELNTIRQQNADTAAKKENDIKEQKINELAAKQTKAENDLAEKQKEFEGKQGNFQQQMSLKDLEFKVTEARHALELAQKDKEFNAKLDETKSQHDAQQAKWDADIKNAQERVRVAEEAIKARPGQTGTVTEQEVKKPGFSVFGYHPFESTDKITTTTKTPMQPGTYAPVLGTKLNPNATSAGTGTYGNIPPDKNKMAAQGANAVIRQKAVDWLKSHNQIINEENIQHVASKLGTQ